jgi:hypothetical protein
MAAVQWLEALPCNGELAGSNRTPGRWGVRTAGCVVAAPAGSSTAGSRMGHPVGHTELHTARLAHASSSAHSPRGRSAGQGGGEEAARAARAMEGPAVLA